MNDRYTTLIGIDDLLALRASDRPLVLLDCSFDLADGAAGERAHATGHVPGSLYAHLDRDLAGPKNGRNGRHPLPDKAGFAATVGRWGIDPQTQVVCFDAQGGPYAARAWWMLQWIGHAPVAVLDGGLAAWTGAGQALSHDTTVPDNRGPYPIGSTTMPTIDSATLLKSLGQRLVVDARAGERFRGEVEPLDAVAGHIPGATNRFFKNNLAADGRFRPASELRAEFDAWGQDASKIVHQCGSGVTACHNLLAMAHAGLTGTTLYPGSWSEWSADPSLPVARG
jgi:thiosulfate/3-mercaptopyruvate sulfurtransferase